MQEFNLWYQEWIRKQELTISHIKVAEAAFKAGMECAKNDTCVKNQALADKEINTHKGSF